MGRSRKIYKHIFASDLHIPFFDKHCLNILIEFLKYCKPDSLILGGDIADMYGISKYIKTKHEWENNLQYEIDEVRRVLGLIRRAYKGKIVYIEGNHEWRMQRYLYSNAKALAQLDCLQIPELFWLDRRDIKYVKSIDGNAIYELRKDLIVMHGSIARKHAAYSAKAIWEDFVVNAAMGHTHRRGTYSKTGYKREWTTMECGCLCNLNDTFKPYPNWQHGFGEITIVGDDYTLKPLAINNGKLIHNDRIFT